MIEKIAYLIKYRSPLLFRGIERIGRLVVVFRYGSRLRCSTEHARLEGSVNGQPALVRILGADDSVELQEFLAGLPLDYLQHFQPHRFDLGGLRKVLKSRAYLNYGLYIDGALVAYALLKIAPTGSAFIGLLVSPEFGRLGLGKFIVAYLYWQASLTGLRTRSTISRHNPASLRAHEAVSSFEVVSELPDDYMMIEFPRVPREKPELNLP